MRSAAPRDEGAGERRGLPASLCFSGGGVFLLYDLTGLACFRRGGASFTSVLDAGESKRRFLSAGLAAPRRWNPGSKFPFRSSRMEARRRPSEDKASGGFAAASFSPIGREPFGFAAAAPIGPSSSFSRKPLSSRFSTSTSRSPSATSDPSEPRSRMSTGSSPISAPPRAPPPPPERTDGRAGRSEKSTVCWLLIGLLLPAASRLLSLSSVMMSGELRGAQRRRLGRGGRRRPRAPERDAPAAPDPSPSLPPPLAGRGPRGVRGDDALVDDLHARAPVGPPAAAGGRGRRGRLHHGTR